MPFEAVTGSYHIYMKSLLAQNLTFVHGTKIAVFVQEVNASMCIKAKRSLMLHAIVYLNHYNIPLAGK